MKFGFVLISNVYNPIRDVLASTSLTSLAKTNMEGINRPSMVLSIATTAFDYNPYVEQFKEKWDVVVTPDVNAGMISNLFVLGVDVLLKDESITHFFFMADDFIYNPEWLRQLTSLIERRPDGIAWAVYRSSYIRHHRILSEDKDDCLMSMHDAVGAVNRSEWLEYQTPHRTDYTVPENQGGGCTIDVHHAFARPGNRWATKRDYMQNIGVHPHLGRFDMAIDFIGE